MPKIEKYLEYPQDTRWATDEEMMSPLSSTRVEIARPPFASAGLILKSDGRTVYVDGQDHHSMIIGSTGSGKSRLLCMPMIGIMANAGESFIATDPKGELFQMTSGLAKESGYQVVVLNFRDFNCGDRWNPLAIPYELYQAGNQDQALSLLNDLVMTLTSKEYSSTDRFWTQMAQSLILANLLLLFETGKKEEINMHSLSRLCLDYGRPRNQNALYQLLPYMNPDSIAAMNYTGVCVDAEKTQSSIMGVVHSVLRVFSTQEGLLRMMSGSTFDMRTFGRKKTAVYLIIPDEKSTFHFLVSTFTKQCYEMLISEAHREADKKLPVRVNFVLDEFANLPVIPDMSNMISAARSRNIRFHLVIQSMNQLESKYGHDATTISSNCENWVYLNSKEYDCLEEISKRCGNLLDNRNQLRPLITPSRLQRLDKERGEALIFHGRQYPYITYLAPISRYDFEVCEPVALTARERGPVSVFHADEILRQLKEGRLAPLFYHRVSPKDSPQARAALRQKKLDGYREQGRSGPATPARRLQQLREKRCDMQKTEGADQELLLYLLDTRDTMRVLGRELEQKDPVDASLKDAWEAEMIYRDSQFLACCSALMGKTVTQRDRKEDFPGEAWLLELMRVALERMMEKQQPPTFYPVHPGRRDLAVYGSAAVAFERFESGFYEECERILGFVRTCKDALFACPALSEAVYRLETLLQEADRLEPPELEVRIQELKNMNPFIWQPPSFGLALPVRKNALPDAGQQETLQQVLAWCRHVWNRIFLAEIQGNRKEEEE